MTSLDMITVLTAWNITFSWFDSNEKTITWTVLCVCQAFQ